MSVWLPENALRVPRGSSLRRGRCRPGRGSCPALQEVAASCLLHLVWLSPQAGCRADISFRCFSIWPCSPEMPPTRLCAPSDVHIFTASAPAPSPAGGGQEGGLSWIRAPPLLTRVSSGGSGLLRCSPGSAGAPPSPAIHSQPTSGGRRAGGPSPGPGRAQPRGLGHFPGPSESFPHLQEGERSTGCDGAQAESPKAGVFP